ncbi:MAG: hypothetical protein GX639_14920 [Fibrobacter sp.]|nr:hypothetical protein [Fibrobacter sp.]
MKIIVVSGACSGVGKSTLARGISNLIPDALTVKIGHHEENIQKEIKLFPMGTSIDTVRQFAGNVPYLIIESNSILIEIIPECVIYLTGESSKPSASLALTKADIIRGEYIDTPKINELALRLSLDISVVRKIAMMAGAKVGAVCEMIPA